MSDRRIERQVLLEYVNELFSESSFIFLSGYQGLNVKTFTGIREKLYDAGARAVVLKNSYIKLGLTEHGVELPEDFDLTGDTIAVIGSDDPCAAAKVLKEEAKSNVQLACKGGAVDGKFVDAAGIEKLADMPPKEVLLGQLLCMMKGPGQSLVRTLSTRKNTIVWTLENYAKKLEEN